MKLLLIKSDTPFASGQRGEVKMETDRRRWVTPFAAVAMAIAMLFNLEEAQANDAEHIAAVMELTPVHQADFVTVQSGAWSDVNTWANGKVPTKNAQVLIADGDIVVFDTVQAGRMEWVRVDGTLQFDNTINTHLYVETLIVGADGKLIVGTAENPIGAAGSSVTARITIADAGEDFDHNVDMQELGRGIISLGRVEMHGAGMTSYAKLAQEALAGDTEFVFDGAPENWHIGDKLVVTGNGRTADETVFIVDISQNGFDQAIVSFDKDPGTDGIQGLGSDHTTPAGYGLSHYVANMNRHVVVASENPDIINRRGHVIFMHNQNVDINYAGFYELGRTDKSRLVNDVSTDADGNQVPGTNVRGRYPVHFHRAGTSIDVTPGHVEGSVVVGSPGWGYVHHDSYANIINNIAYGVQGAAFAQEFGNERGTFTRNLAIRSVGKVGNALSSMPERIPLFDHGFAGHGFWMHSASLSVIDNIAAGSGESGFAYWGKGKSAGNAPVTNFIGNTTFGSKVGMMQWKFLRPKNVMDNFTVWATGQAVWMEYGRRLALKDSTIIGNLDNPRGSALAATVLLDWLSITNSAIVGWERVNHFTLPMNETVISGGYFNNLNSFTFGVGNKTRPQFNNVEFGELSEEVLNGRTQWHINFLPGLGLETPDFRQEFMSIGVGVMIDGQQLYRNEQAPDYINFTHGGLGTPSEFVGKTNQQIFDEYGVAPGGGIAPADAVRVPGFDGLLGEPSNYDNVLATLLSREFTNQLDNYLLSFRTADGQVITETVPTAPLREGWNAITREVDGVMQTVFVFGDITPPEFQEAAYWPYRIERSVDYSVLHEAFRFGTRVADVPMSSQKIGFTLRGLNTLPIEGSIQQGNVYVTKTISFTDWAGNSASAEVRVYIKNYPRPPVAYGDSATVNSNTPTVINVLKNDFDRDLDPLTIVSVSKPAHGTVVLSENQITYTSNPGYAGTDSFIYTISDGKGGTAQANVNITVTSVVASGAAPVAVQDFVSVVSGQGPVTIDVLANDYDPDGDALTIVSLNLNFVRFGTIEQVGNQLTYTPREDVSWADEGFFYTISDGNGNTSRTAVGIQIRPASTVGSINNLPVAVNDLYTTAYEKVLDIPAAGLLSNDSDSDGDVLSASLTSSPSNGLVTVNADGSFSYTPNTGFSGVDSFTYTVDDGNDGSATATVEITIEAQTEAAIFTNMATSSSTRFGKVSGSYLDTHGADGASQTITEVLKGRRKKNRKSVLLHSWTFDVTGGNIVSFHATAGHNSSVETFRFDYNDGSGWKPLFKLTSKEMNNYSTTLPASVSGTITVRVIDTNRRRRERSRDTVQIDEMHFRSEAFK